MTVVIIYAESCSWKGFKIDLRRPFFSFKTFSTYGGVQLYAQDFQKRPSSDLMWRGTTTRDFVAPLATSRPKKLTPLAKKLVKWTCC